MPRDTPAAASASSCPTPAVAASSSSSLQKVHCCPLVTRRIGGAAATHGLRRDFAPSDHRTKARGFLGTLHCIIAWPSGSGCTTEYWCASLFDGLGRLVCEAVREASAATNELSRQICPPPVGARHTRVTYQSNPGRKCTCSNPRSNTTRTRSSLNQQLVMVRASPCV